MRIFNLFRARGGGGGGGGGGGCVWIFKILSTFFSGFAKISAPQAKF